MQYGTDRSANTYFSLTEVEDTMSSLSLSEIIQNNYRCLKQEKGLTTKQMDEVGIGKTTLNDMLNRSKNGFPSIETLEKLAKAFDVPITYFFEEHELVNHEREYLISYMTALYDRSDERDRRLIKSLLEAFPK